MTEFLSGFLCALGVVALLGFAVLFRGFVSSKSLTFDFEFSTEKSMAGFALTSVALFAIAYACLS